MRISVLLINWNGLEYLKTCLEALAAQGHGDFEIILADNGSEDGSQDFVREQHPKVKLIELGENTGLAKANNVAAEHASGELLFVVNTDTDFEPDLLETLEFYASENPEYDIFSPQMICFSDRSIVDCKGMRFHRTLRAQMIGMGEPVEPEEDAYEIFGATGGAMLIRRRVYDQIGLFDAEIFFNNEDVDFSLRAFGSGFRTLYAPRARVYHHRSPYEKRMPDTVLYYIQRNIELAAYKNVPLSIWLKYGPLHLAFNAYHLLKCLKRGKGRVFLKAKWDALKMTPKLDRKPLDAARMEEIFGKVKL